VTVEDARTILREVSSDERRRIVEESVTRDIETKLRQRGLAGVQVDMTPAIVEAVLITETRLEATAGVRSLASVVSELETRAKLIDVEYGVRLDEASRGTEPNLTEQAAIAAERKDADAELMRAARAKMIGFGMPRQQAREFEDINALLEAARRRMAADEEKAQAARDAFEAAPVKRATPRAAASNNLVIVGFEQPLLTPEQQLIAKHGNVLRLVRAELESRGEGALGEEIALAVAQLSEENITQPVLDWQTQAIASIARERGVAPSKPTNRVEATAWIAGNHAGWRARWVDTLMRAAEARAAENMVRAAERPENAGEAAKRAKEVPVVLSLDPTEQAGTHGVRFVAVRASRIFDPQGLVEGSWSGKCRRDEIEVLKLMAADEAARSDAEARGVAVPQAKTREEHLIALGYVGEARKVEVTEEIRVEAARAARADRAELESVITDAGTRLAALRERFEPQHVALDQPQQRTYTESDTRAHFTEMMADFPLGTNFELRGDESVKLSGNWVKVAHEGGEVWYNGFFSYRSGEDFYEYSFGRQFTDVNTLVGLIQQHPSVIRQAERVAAPDGDDPSVYTENRSLTHIREILDEQPVGTQFVIREAYPQIAGDYTKANKTHEGVWTKVSIYGVDVWQDEAGRLRPVTDFAAFALSQQVSKENTLYDIINQHPSIVAQQAWFADDEKTGKEHVHMARAGQRAQKEAVVSSPEYAQELNALAKEVRERLVTGGVAAVNVREAGNNVGALIETARTQIEADDAAARVMPETVTRAVTRTDRQITVFQPSYVRTLSEGVSRGEFVNRLDEWEDKAVKLADREQVGNEIATREELAHAEFQLRSAEEQAELRRYKVETENGERRLSVHDVEQQAMAMARRHTALHANAAINAEQEKEPGKRRNSRQIRQEILKEAYETELAGRSDVIEEIRSKHAAAISRLEQDVEKATRAEANARNLAEDVRREYAARGFNQPAPYIATARLDKLQDNAIMRRDTDTLITLEMQRQEQIENTEAEPKTRRTEAAAHLAGQHRLAKLDLTAAEDRAAKFDETAHMRRFTVEGHDRNAFGRTEGQEQGEGPNHEWSLKDVADAQREAQKNKAYFEKSAAFHNSNHHVYNLLDYAFNPLKGVKSELRMVTNPIQSLNNHLNPIRVVTMHPAYRIGRFLYDYANSKAEAKECARRAAQEAEKINRLEEVREQVTSKMEAARAEVAESVAQNRQVFNALDAVTQAEQLRHAAAGTEMPSPSFREHEIRMGGARAFDLNDAEALKEFDALAREAQAEGLLAEENLAARAIGRETVAAARCFDLQAQIASLGKEVTEGLTIRDVTPVRVEIEGVERVVTARDVAEASEEVQGIVQEALASYEAGLQAKLEGAYSFYDGVRELADSYRSALASVNTPEPLPQFSVKEHIELERFAAKIEDEQLHERFTEIVKEALAGGRVVGIQKSHSIPAAQPGTDEELGTEQAAQQGRVTEEVRAQAQAVETIETTSTAQNALNANALAADTNAPGALGNTPVAAPPQSVATPTAQNLAQAGGQLPVPDAPPQLPYTVTVPPPLTTGVASSVNNVSPELSQTPEITSDAVEAAELAEEVEAEDAAIGLIELL
jgi:hypothetical protein